MNDSVEKTTQSLSALARCLEEVEAGEDGKLIKKAFEHISDALHELAQYKMQDELRYRDLLELVRNSSIKYKQIDQFDLDDVCELEDYLNTLNKNKTILDLSKKGIRELPDCIGQFTQLKELNLSQNQLTSLPHTIGQLTQLTKLLLYGNQLTNLPDSIGRLTQLTELSLASNQFTMLPESIRQLTQLTRLNLYNNQLTNLPDSIGRLTQLTELSLSSTQLTTLPDSIGRLTQLTELPLSFNQLTTLPDSIGQLTQLVNLNLKGNQLTTLPDSIGQLTQLVNLNLEGNQFTTLPDSIGQLTQLINLNLGGNHLTVLPNSIGQLSVLHELILDNHQLTSLPDSIGQLTQLKYLYLKNNQLTTLPESIGQLVQLEGLHLDGNPLINPPQEILSRGINSIRDYFQQITQQDVDYLYEAKLLIVGDPGAGKTTLLEKLLNPNYPVPNDSESTVGVNIRQWFFDTHNDKGEQVHFRTNLWDFGGQKIQYMTHQFFLTSRSFYILVSDDRDQRTNFEYWLNMVEVLGNKSPLLILLNEKKHQGMTNFSLPYYQKHYPGMIKEVRDIDFADNDDGRYQTLITHLQQHLSQLNHIGDPLPKRWIPIREALEQQQKDHHYISFKDYQLICQNHGITEEQQQLTLSQYLHDLGTILHFQNDADISHWIVLNPPWVVDAVYTILADKTVHKQHGRFDKDWLFEQWKNYGRDEQHFLLSLMLKNRFDICYAMDASNNHYIVPQLLPVMEPQYHFDRTDNLLFRYQYKFMPFGLLPRLVVRLSDQIDQQQGEAMNWQTGLIINQGSVTALIEENTSEEGLKIIDIRVTGDTVERKECLSYIRKTIESIHNDSYKNIVYDAMIPCNQCIKQRIEFPRYLPYADLTNLISNNVQKNVCGRCSKEYSPSEMIFGVMTQQESDREKNMTTINIGIVNGDFNHVISERINNSFNKINQSQNISDELKLLLQELSNQVSDIIEKVPTDKADEISQDLEHFTSQAIADKPYQKWYQVSADGLIQAATALGKITSPIISTVKAILKILNP